MHMILYTVLSCIHLYSYVVCWKLAIDVAIRLKDTTYLQAISGWFVAGCSPYSILRYQLQRGPNVTIHPARFACIDRCGRKFAPAASSALGGSP